MEWILTICNYYPEKYILIDFDIGAWVWCTKDPKSKPYLSSRRSDMKTISNTSKVTYLGTLVSINPPTCLQPIRPYHQITHLTFKNWAQLEKKDRSTVVREVARKCTQPL